MSRTGSQRRVASATPAPSATPVATSLVQCTPTCTREYATVRASGTTHVAAFGLSIATAVANAAAEAAWPEGNDDDVGGKSSERYSGSSSAAGRRRGTRGLSTPLASRLAPVMASVPRRAPRRVWRVPAASTAATPNQSLLWLADLVSAASAGSAAV